MDFARSVTFAAPAMQFDRAAHLRELSDDLLRHRKAALLPFWRDKLLCESSGGLAWVPPLKEHLAEASDLPIFLGMSGETPCFAADFSDLEQVKAEEYFCDGAGFVELRSVAADLSPTSAALAATAKGMLGWHLSHGFCARCGGESEMELGGWRRRCDRCDALHFPRTDPVVIMLVVREDHVLLARQSFWAEGLYSLIAGYVEPGETIEDAVRRETLEETSIKVGRVDYVGCQPWPFPTSLMFGCIASAESSAIEIDENELQDAQWVSRAKVEVILSGRHPRMVPPIRYAIASSMLHAWIDGSLKVG